MGHCIDHFAHAPLSSTSITTLPASRHDALFNNSSSEPIGEQLQGRSGPTKGGPAEASRLWQSIQDGPSSLKVPVRLNHHIIITFITHNTHVSNFKISCIFMYVQKYYVYDKLRF